MTGESTQESSHGRALTALAHGGPETDWEWVEGHLATCATCGAGLEQFTAAINDQIAGARMLDPIPDLAPPATDAVGATQAVVSPVLSFAPATGTQVRAGKSPLRWRSSRMVAALSGIAAALLVLVGVLAGRASSGGAGVRSVAADRRPEFVPSLQVLPARADNTYFAGEQVQICATVNQPSRIHLSVLEGHSTFDLYDAESDPGSHCFTERITSGLRSRATLRIEVFFGSERVAREDEVLLPATPTTVP